tara:strand:- start:119 stop:838 length:720 start_codon:yes stop_codon:yes gene_type:complete
MAKSYIDLEENLKKHFPLKIKHLTSEEELTFKAMITQFEDQYSSEWNVDNVFGRMDPIRTFRGTQRVITLGWDVVAANLEEATANMERCGKLMAMLYPSYTSDPTRGSKKEVAPEMYDGILSGSAGFATGNAADIKAAPLFQIKFANLISNASTAAQTDSASDGVVGTIDGLVYAPDIEQDFFSAGPGLLYPQTIRLSFALYVAHTHPLGWQSGKPKALRQPGFPYFVKGSGNNSGGNA